MKPAMAHTGPNIDSLDGLRGIACIFVFLSHAGNMGLFANLQKAGNLAIMIFFVLSGFLMSYLYGQGQLNRKVLVSYFSRRVFRIYPLFVAALLFSYVMHSYTGNFAYPITLEELQKHLLLQGKVSVFWTIPVEMKFYLIFPLIALIISWISEARHKFFACCLFFLMFAISNPSHGKISAWTHIEFFICGMAAAHLYELIKYSYHRYQTLINVIFAMTLVATVLCAPTIFQSIFGFNHMLWWSAKYFAPMYGICVITCALSSGFINKIFSNPVSRFFGFISYSLYLIHLPVIRLVRDSLQLHQVLELIIAFLVSVVLSVVSYYLIETPARRLGSKLAKRINGEKEASTAAL